MAWCKVSSLTAAVVAALRGVRYPVSKAKILSVTRGRLVEGWEVSYFLENSLKKERYRNLRAVMSDLESWLEKQG